METDRATTENPDRVTLDNHEQAAAGASPVRSYDCTFCKRGFSNAQALGGHMNIHRKDKVKLKQTLSNNQNQQSFDILKIRPSYSFPVPTNTPIQPPSIEVKASQEINRSTTERPWILGEEIDATNTDKTHVREVRQLHLFVEKPVSSDRSPGIQIHENTEKVSSSSSSLGSELDLELRLGHEPQESTSATGTKKFF